MKDFKNIKLSKDERRDIEKSHEDNYSIEKSQAFVAEMERLLSQ